jgi:type IV fimbrial biogenesis protein FimT
MPQARQHPQPAQHLAAGFTLIELLVTIGVLAVLAALTAPSMVDFVRSARANQLSGALVASLRQGRNEAMKRNIGVLVCANDGTNQCSNSTDWGVRGWLVCYAASSTTTCDSSTPALPNPIMIQSAQATTSALVAGPSTAIRFTPYGAQGSTTNVVLTITGTWANPIQLKVTVYPSGQVMGTRMTSQSTHT